MTRKYSSTSVETTLASGINTTQTTMTVPSSTAATLLLGGQTLAPGNVDIFTVVIDPDTVNEEVVFVTNVSGDTLTISRGQAGTGTAGVSGIAHSAGATIRHSLTSSDLDFFRNGVATADAAIAKSIVDAKGDIITATADNTPVRLAVGTNDQYLKVNSSTATGLEWAAVPPSKIAQVVSTNLTASFTTTSNSYVDVTNMNVSITPSASTSKVSVNFDFLFLTEGDPDLLNIGEYRILRGATEVWTGYIFLLGGTVSSMALVVPVSISFVDSPSTTSSTTYKLQIKKQSNGLQVSVSNSASMVLQEVIA